MLTNQDIGTVLQAGHPKLIGYLQLEHQEKAREKINIFALFGYCAIKQSAV